MHAGILPPNRGPQQNEDMSLIDVWVHYVWVLRERAAVVMRSPPHLSHSHNRGPDLLCSRLGGYNVQDAPKNTKLAMLISIVACCVEPSTSS